MSAFVSIVIPTYNRANDLKRALTSVVAQTYKNWEAIVVDNCSIDATDDVVAAFCDCRIKLFKINNYGIIAASRNLGLAHAKGEYVAFLDSDDWWSVNKLEVCVKSLEAGFDLVFHDLWIVDRLEQYKFYRKIRSGEPKSPLFERMLCAGVSIPNSSVVVRASVIRAIGNICEDKEIVSVEDFDTWLKIAKLLYRFHRIAGVYGYYWSGGGNMSAASSVQIDKINSIYDRHMADLPRNKQVVALGFLAYRIGRIAINCGLVRFGNKKMLEAIMAPIGVAYRIKAVIFWLKSMVFFSDATR